MKIAHVNADHAKQEQNKLKIYKPKVMVGDLRKPNCEFTSDLVSLQHNTRFVKKYKEVDECKGSDSLQELRLQERMRRATKVMVK